MLSGGVSSGEIYLARFLFDATPPPRVHRDKNGVASGNPFESKLYGWLRELVKLRDVFMADPATAKLLAV